MHQSTKGILSDLWEKVRADAAMDNAAKAKLAEETARNVAAGLQTMFDWEHRVPGGSESREEAAEQTEERN